MTGSCMPPNSSSCSAAIRPAATERVERLPDLRDQVNLLAVEVRLVEVALARVRRRRDRSRSVRRCRAQHRRSRASGPHSAAAASGARRRATRTAGTRGRAAKQCARHRGATSASGRSFAASTSSGAGCQNAGSACGLSAKRSIVGDHLVEAGRLRVEHRSAGRGPGSRSPSGRRRRCRSRAARCPPRGCCAPSLTSAYMQRCTISSSEIARGAMLDLGAVLLDQRIDLGIGERRAIAGLVAIPALAGLLAEAAHFDDAVADARVA